MYRLDFMWCLMMNFPQLHPWEKAQYPQIGHILCNTAQKAVHQRILTSRTVGSLHILRKIPVKTQAKIWLSLHRIIIKFSHIVVTKLRNSKKERKLSLTIFRGNTFSPFIYMCWKGEYGKNCPVKKHWILGLWVEVEWIFQWDFLIDLINSSN